MSDRHLVLGAMLTLIGLPAVIVPIEAAWYYAANRDNGSFVSDGERREYLLYVPTSYRPASQTPLVISMHGAGLWGAAQKDISQWNAVADREGFIVVYPSGVGGRGVRAWRARPGPGLAKEVRFLSALIDTIAANYHIDLNRVYANGLSNGGGMSFMLSCTLSDRIAAVGLVASAQLTPFMWCPDRRPVPMINFHGTDDNAAGFKGGTSWVVADIHLPNQETWTANWARRNRCAPSPADSQVAPDVIRRSYSKCADDGDVVLYTIIGGGHTWPGTGRTPEWFTGRTTHSIDATQLMWEFFRAHPLRQAGTQ